VYLNIIKAVSDKPTASIVLSRGKTETIPSKIMNKTRVFTLSTPIQCRAEIVRVIRQEKEIKGMQT
jgi:hypothetical protein